MRIVIIASMVYNTAILAKQYYETKQYAQINTASKKVKT